MKANEFVKKIGWEKSLALWGDRENDVISHKGFKVNCLFLGDLLRSYAIVCAFGGVELAKKKACKIGLPLNGELLKAIQLVESCQ